MKPQRAALTYCQVVLAQSASGANWIHKPNITAHQRGQLLAKRRERSAKAISKSPLNTSDIGVSEEPPVKISAQAISQSPKAEAMVANSCLLMQIFLLTRLVFLTCSHHTKLAG